MGPLELVWTCCHGLSGSSLVLKELYETNLLLECIQDNFQSILQQLLPFVETNKISTEDSALCLRPDVGASFRDIM